MIATKTKTSELVEQLADLFRRAEQAALAADPGDGLHNDGGTSNFDTPAFRIERVRQATIETAAKLAGVGVCQFDWFSGKTWYWLHVTLRGQGSRRSKMAEAAARVLRQSAEANEIPGFRACLYCQAD